MNRRHVLTLGALALLAGTGVPAAAVAQTARDVAGTYELVSVVSTAADGTKTDFLGPNPKGIAVYERGGRFVVVLTRSDLPKFASGSRLQGTADENKAIVQGSISYFGTWSVTGKVITLHVDGGSWPAWNGTDQTREIAALDKKGLTTVNAAPSVGGPPVTTVWRRVK